MPWCPICQEEYADGYSQCADCGYKLVDVLWDEEREEVEWWDEKFIEAPKREYIKRFYSVDITDKKLNYIVNRYFNNRVLKAFIVLAVAVSLLLLGAILVIVNQGEARESSYSFVFGVASSIFFLAYWPWTARASVKRLIQTNSLYCVNEIINGYVQPDPVSKFAFEESFLYCSKDGMIVKYDDVCWVYGKKSVQHMNYSYTKTDESLVVWLKNGDSFTISTGTSDKMSSFEIVDAHRNRLDTSVIAKIAAFNTHILLGYTEENKRAYKYNKWIEKYKNIETL
jgi:hypothetical protein